MTQSKIDQHDNSPAAFVKAASPWLTVFAVLLILLGIFAIAHPAITAIATGLIIAVTLLLAGVASLLAIASDRDASGRLAHAVFGVLAIGLGGYLVAIPTAGAVELVWLIGALFAVSGLFDILAAFRLNSNRMYLLLLGAANLIIGIYALFLIPGDAIEVLAILIGISLILRGIVIAWAALWMRRALG